ncbi:FtsX-like permease family protein [Raineyella sp. LH-20]|uniref:FtsX-like permease family protein n=1 Tax=Raineyella sp. LH-20 TaxID=3081204 RepID=UPI00295375A4|nr:FtsX-like permease family protein [Raineyella sp. LH-20]WOP19066.1 ABC transporter permease [Raineyella sp. LH-20]
MSASSDPSALSPATNRPPEAVPTQLSEPTAAGRLPEALPLPTHRGPLRPTWTLLALLARPTLRDRAAWGLPVTAFAVISTIILDVTGGAAMFWSFTGELAGTYRLLSSIAVVLLVLPLVTLASSAARLSARRRDDRLSSLRLLGATSLTLRLVTLAEAGTYALAGALLGCVGYAMTLPLLGLLSFDGHRIGAAALLLGPGPLAAVVAALVVLALVSSALGLRAVAISPLGVRMRSTPQSVSRARIVIGVLLLVVAVLATKIAPLFGVQSGPVVALAVGLFAIAVALEVIDIVGPRLLAVHFRRGLRRARTAEALVAARTVLESPKQAWRQVAALGSVCFVGVAGGSGVALLERFSTGAGASDMALVQDIRTGVLLTIVFAFATVACSVGINQAAAVLDRRRVEVGLDLIGMDLTRQDRARRRTVLGPLWFVMVVSIASAAVVLLPLVGAALVLSPATLVVTAAVMVVGALFVVLGLRATRPSLARVLADGLARTE